MYILSSQPELTKLYNENIGGHYYIFTVSLNISLSHSRSLKTSVVFN